jgi:hypothetical protein
VAVRALLCCGADAVRVLLSDRVTDEMVLRAKTDYMNVHSFIEEYHSILKYTLSELVEVDKRVGRGDNGINQEPMERVLEYLGMSMNKDQIVNTSIDGEDDARRVLKRGDWRSAELWYTRYYEVVRLEAQIHGFAGQTYAVASVMNNEEKEEGVEPE